MRGRNHLRMGACTVAATATIALPQFPDALNRPFVLAAGVGLFLYGKVAPDLDHPTSAVTRSWGWLTRALSAWIIRPAARYVYNRSRTRADGARPVIHRGFTHTLPGAGVAGLVAAWTIMSGPGYAAVFLALALGMAARVYDRGWQGWAALAGGAAGWFLWLDLLAMAPWLGFAVAVGCYAHAVDDCVTTAGAPLAWPLRDGEGRRWGRKGTPEWMRFDTGSGVETAVVWSAIVVTSAFVYALAIAPWLQPILIDVFTDGVG